MDPERFLEIQKQMRQNNEEISNFLNDFGSWKADVERKDAELQNIKDPDIELPAVRNSLFQKHRKKTKFHPKSAKKPTERISGQDYRSWDKFDVDKALAEIDEIDSAKIPSDPSSTETDEELENRRRIALSKEARELGNLRFKEGDYLEAIEHYTSSVRLTPEDPIPLTNRAMANLKLERFASAETDCSLALCLDQKCVKALFRRALARKHLNKVSDAVNDLESILQLDRENKAAIKELAKLNQRPEEGVKQCSTTTAITLTGDHTNLSNSGRKFRRVPIVEVSGSDDCPSSVHNGVCYPSCDIGPRSPVTPVSIDPAANVPANPCKSVSQQLQPSVPVAAAPLVTLCPDGPSNWFQLERELRELNKASGDVLNDAAVAYLCDIPPERYSQVIGSNLDTAFLVKMIHALCFARVLSPQQIIARLDRLSQLPRFDVAWMLADDRDREQLGCLINRLERETDLPCELVHSVRSRLC